MTQTQTVPPGAATVGLVADLHPLPALAVELMRLWCDGPRGRDKVTATMAERLAPTEAEQAVDALVSIWVLLAWQGRRAVMSHGPQTPVLCADEACLAVFLDTAARGDRSDAMLMAVLLVRPDAAGDLTDAAQTLGARLSLVAGTLAPIVVPAPPEDAVAAGHSLPTPVVAVRGEACD